MSKNVLTLDVREEIRQGREPFSLIMRTVMGLKAGQSLLLVAPFEPVPLYGVMANKGFSHRSTTTPEGDWQILFERQSEAVDPSTEVARPPCPVQDKPAVVVDARGLEPPEPLVKILEAVSALPAGASLDAYTDRRPMHLLTQLEERGFTGASEPRPDGSFVTHIRQCPAP